MSAAEQHIIGAFEAESVHIEKPRMTEILRGAKLSAEIRDMRERGYDVTIGDTEDRAYDDTDRLWAVFGQLKAAGREYQRRVTQGVLGVTGLASMVEYSDHAPRSLRRRVRTEREAARKDILYSQPDIQAMAWHLQGGKALALGTIVDAHDLMAEGYESEAGLYPTMSGQIDENLLWHVFRTRGSGNIAHKGIWQSHLVTNMEFNGKDYETAARRAETEKAKLAQFLQAPVKKGFKEIVEYCTDSLGIRSRKEEVQKEILRHVGTIEKKNGEDILMMSVGCGTAQSMLEVMHELRVAGRDGKLILIDQDPIALAAAGQLAMKMGLEDAVEIHCAKLFKKDRIGYRVMDIQSVLKGRQLDACEDSGLREYFPDSMYKDLTRQIWDSLSDDGLMTTGNMNKNRPQAEFLHGLMGWPIPVRMRHIRDIARLHEKAGVPKSSTRYRVTQDGVYTLGFSSKKPVLTEA